jgi:hypothetical protein
VSVRLESDLVEGIEDRVVVPATYAPVAYLAQTSSSAARRCWDMVR